MGSGSSHLGSPPPTTKVNRTKQRLASLICGASSSYRSPQREDHAAESLVNSADYCEQLADKSPSPTNEYILNGGTGFTSRSGPKYEPGASSEISTTTSVHASIADDSHIESSSKRKCFCESDEVVPPPQIIAESKHYQQRPGDTANAPCTAQIRSVSVNPNRHASGDVHDPVSNDMPWTSPDFISPTPSTVQSNELERLPSPFEEINEAMENHIPDSGRMSVASEPIIASQSRRREAVEDVTPSGLGLFVSDRVQARPEGSLLHVDVVSITSNVLPNSNNEISTREARRNSRRMFWDAFSSRGSRRHADFPAILLTTEDSDLMGANRRWLLDIGDDFFNDGVGLDSWHFGRRSRATNERRRNSRSEFWDRLQGAASESSRRTTCPLDLHPDGSCSCELHEQASALTSISRIVLLAEALFEVLDEIHRQPESFSLSMLSVPAPASVVDSLPVKAYEKPNTADRGDDVDQCYICLVEYEEADKIRVLPCHHEYHMSCVDRWLKEVHGVCPLCRGDVRGGGVREGAASSSDANLT